MRYGPKVIFSVNGTVVRRVGAPYRRADSRIVGLACVCVLSANKDIALTTELVVFI